MKKTSTHRRLWTGRQIFDAVIKALYRDDVPGVPAWFVCYAAALTINRNDSQITELHKALSRAARRAAGGAR